MAGEELWRRELAGDIAATSTVDEGHLFVHSSVGLHALTVEGEEIWFFESPDLGPLVDGRSWGWGNEILADPWGWYRSAPRVDGETVAFGMSGGVQAVSRETGELLRQVPLGPVKEGNHMKAIGLTQYLPIDDDASLLDIERPARVGAHHRQTGPGGLVMRSAVRTFYGRVGPVPLHFR